jgi:hypothetical protein
MGVQNVERGRLANPCEIGAGHYAKQFLQDRREALRSQHSHLFIGSEDENYWTLKPRPVQGARGIGALCEKSLHVGAATPEDTVDVDLHL